MLISQESIIDYVCVVNTTLEVWSSKRFRSFDEDIIGKQRYLNENNLCNMYVWM